MGLIPPLLSLVILSLGSYIWRSIHFNRWKISQKLMIITCEETSSYGDNTLFLPYMPKYIIFLQISIQTILLLYKK